ncbi:MAG: sulfide/dihydroorotate dehydrogenase-like FAD/NAD-binding protein, partial [Fusobacteriaceae bacterium]|nr:sulfide/dihydroorotate dehydrogenase-like FAD/NAD-binding protein [Fusobacteriaceae bacterium]
MYKIISKENLNSTVEKMVVEAPFIAKKCGAGQFLMVMVEEDGERIPLTIADYDRDKQTVTIIYQVVGYSTKLLNQKQAGDFIFAVSGPMGKKVHIEEGAKRVLGIAGGVGAAPIFPQLRELHDNGISVDLVLGARNKDYVILEDDFSKITENRYICTDDGSSGIKGFVTDKLKELIASGEKYDYVIAIGPLPMMRAVVNITKEMDIKTYVSLNPIMIDGTGMCGGCRLTYDGETKFACVDGPDFDGFKV